MHYLDKVKTQVKRLPFTLGAVVAAYYVSVYFGWRVPIEDITPLVALGGIVSYIFIVPFLEIMNIYYW